MIAVAAFAGLGCGGESPGAVDAGTEVDATTPDAAAIDARPVDAANIDAPSCSGPGLMMCGNECVNTFWDPQHCGSCSGTCSGDTASCGAGTCMRPQSTIWERHYGGTTTGNVLTSVAMDGSGNTYVTGSFRRTIDLGGGALTSAGTNDVIIASFAPGGEHRWSRRVGSGGDDNGWGVTTVAGTVYVIGSFEGTVDFGGAVRTSAGSWDAFVLQLASADGAFRALRAFGSTGGEWPSAVVADAAGNYTVAGLFGTGTVDLGGGHRMSGAADANAFVASFSPAGTYRWSRTPAVAAGTYNSITSLTLDSNGNVIAGGFFEVTADLGGGPVFSSGAGSTNDAFVASYSNTGTHRWSRVFGSVDDDSTSGVAADGQGNIVAGGTFQGTVDFGSARLTTNGFLDGWLAVLDGTTGQTRLARKIGAIDYGEVAAVAADDDGHPIIAALVGGALDLGAGPVLPENGPIMVASFDPSTGNPVFAKRYATTGPAHPWSIAEAPGGAKAVSGMFERSADLGLGPVSGGTMGHGFVMMIAP